jgi:hypothetical protein
MQALLLIVITLSSSLIYAQPGGGGMQGGRMRGGGQGGDGMQQREIPEFNASKTVGIFNYDPAEVIKKLKLKKNEKDLELDIRKAMANYNNNINEIALLNKDNFDTLNVFMNTIIKSSMANRQNNRDGGQGQMGGSRMDRGDNSVSLDDNPMFKARKLAREKTQPARVAVIEEENKLNNRLEALLSEKKYNKWLKYQEDVKEDLNPKPQSNNQNQGQMSGGMGRGQGGGGQRGGGMR